MITVAVIGILAAVAYPSFQDSIRKGRREDGRTLLLAAQLSQEKFRLNNATYTNATTALTGACPTSGACNSQEGYYTLSISGNSATGYTLTATAVSGKSQASDTGCTAMVISFANMVSTRTPTACWPK